MKKNFLVLTVITTSCLFASSQDKIFRQNGKIIEAKIIEISAGEVKYREYNSPEGIIYVLESDRIKKIVFENGTEQKFTDNLKDMERYAGQRKKGVKMNFLSMLYGYTEIGFEKNTGYGKGFEVSLGLIGAGKSGPLDFYDSRLGEVKRNPSGVFISCGYKLGKLPDLLIFGKTRASHLLQGTYVKPILYLGYYKENIIVYKVNSGYEAGKQHITFGALQIEIGRQWVFGDRFLLDIYEGFGYGFDNKKQAPDLLFEENSTAFNYVNARLGKSPGFSYTFGVKLGWLIK
jgi:hypothetical protein